MKYSTYETLKRSAGSNAGIAADLRAFDAAMMGEYQTDPLGVSILRTCLLTPQLVELTSLSGEEAVAGAMVEMAECLKQEHGLKPYAAEWAVNAWCSALGCRGYYCDVDYLNSIDEIPMSECIALAERHDAHAAYTLAYRYGVGGNGVTQCNETEARRWEKVGCDLMHTGCIAFAAISLEDEEKYDESFQLVSRGYAFAPDPSLLGVLGEYYLKGWGCEKDEKRALSIFLEGTEYSKNKCLWGAGVCYSTGAGCEKDIPRAYEYFIQGANQGHGPSAKNAYLLIANRMVEATAEDTFRLCEKAVDAGFDEYTSDLARMYINGDGVEKNPAHAVELLQQGAAEGDAASMGLLGRCLMQGVGIRENPREAIKWLEKGAENDDLDSCLLMCRIALMGTKEYPMHKGKGYQYAAQARELGASEEDLPEEVRQGNAAPKKKVEELPADSGSLLRMVTDHSSPVEWRAAGKVTTCAAAYIRGLEALGERCPLFERRWFYYITMMAMQRELGSKLNETEFCVAAFHCLEVMLPNVAEGASTQELIDEYFDLEEKLETDEDFTVNAVVTIVDACDHKRVLKEASQMAYGHIKTAIRAVADM